MPLDTSNPTSPIAHNRKQSSDFVPLKVLYSDHGVDMTKTIMAQENTTALNFIESAVKKFHLENGTDEFCLLIESPKNSRRLLKPSDFLLQHCRASGSPDAGISLIKRQISSSQMLGPSVYREKLTRIMAQNRFCFDCLQKDPSFIVQNLGIAVCAACAAVHAFDLTENGKFISVVRPIHYGNTSVEMLLSMELRGNEGSKKQFPLAPQQLKVADRKQHIKEKYAEPIKYGGVFSAFLLDKDINGMISAWLAGHDVNELKEETLPALHYASLAGDESLVGLLLAMGADSLLCNRSGHTALYYAVQSGNHRLLEIISKNQVARAAVSCVKDLSDNPSSRDALRENMRHAETGWRSVGLDNTQLSRLFSDVCLEIERRNNVQPPLMTGNSPRDKLSKLIDTEFKDLVQLVFREQELREFILMEGQMARKGKMAAYSSDDWLTKLQRDQEAEKMGMSLISRGDFYHKRDDSWRFHDNLSSHENLRSRDKPIFHDNLSSRDNPSFHDKPISHNNLHSGSGGIEIVDSAIKSTLQKLQDELKSMTAGDTSPEARETVDCLVKQFCEQFVQIPGYSPDLICETKLVQLGVSAKKIRNLLEDFEDIRREVGNILILTHDVMHLLGELLQ